MCRVDKCTNVRVCSFSSVMSGHTLRHPSKKGVVLRLSALCDGLRGRNSGTDDNKRASPLREGRRGEEYKKTRGRAKRWVKQADWGRKWQWSQRKTHGEKATFIILNSSHITGPGCQIQTPPRQKQLKRQTRLPLNPSCDVLPSGLMDCLFSCVLLALRFGSGRYCFKRKSYRTERYFLIASFLIVSCLNTISLYSPWVLFDSSRWAAIWGNVWENAAVNGNILPALCVAYNEV